MGAAVPGLKAGWSPVGRDGAELFRTEECMKNSKAVVKVMQPKNQEEGGDIAPLMKQVLEHLGEDPSREGLVRTPVRTEKALKFLTSGYRTDLDKIVNGALFKV